MPRHLVPAAIGRGACDAARAAGVLRCPAREFSSSISRPTADDATPPGSTPPNRTPGPKPTGKERSRQAGAAIGALARPKAPSQDSPRPVIDAASLKARLAAAKGAKIINMRSLPRAAPGENPFSDTPQERGPRKNNFNRPFRTPAGSTPRPSGGPRSSGGATAPGRRPPRRGPGGPGGGSNRGPSRRRRGAPADGEAEEMEEAEEDTEGMDGPEGSNKPLADWQIADQEEERRYFERLKRGLPERYNPDTTLESLLGYMQPLATDSPLGKVGTVMANLRALAWREPWEPQVEAYDPRDSLNKLRADGVLLMSKHEERAAIEKVAGQEIAGPDETVRRTILEKAVMGRYEAAEYVDNVTDAVVLARSVHRMAGSYHPFETRGFEEKLSSLLQGSKGGAARPAPAGAKGKAETPAKGGKAAPKKGKVPA